jgi:hypothetical protein
MSASAAVHHAEFKMALEKHQAFVIGYPGQFDLDGRRLATRQFTMRFRLRRPIESNGGKSLC